MPTTINKTPMIETKIIGTDSINNFCLSNLGRACIANIL
jgi:hypothetical protein